MIANLLWFAGIHGDNIVTGLLNPIFMANLATNAALVAHGAATTQTLTAPFWSFYVCIGGSGSTLVLAFLYIRSRTIPVMLDIARTVEQWAPDAWIINFTNPAGMVTEAVSRYTKAKIIGLCNVPISMHHMIANMLNAPYKDVQLRFAGLNHMVWVHQVLQNGRDVTGNVIDMLCDGATLTMNNIKEAPWPPAFLRAVGAIPCPYHRYFYQTQEMLVEEIEAADDAAPVPSR